MLGDLSIRRCLPRPCTAVGDLALSGGEVRQAEPYLFEAATTARACRHLQVEADAWHILASVLVCLSLGPTKG